MAKLFNQFSLNGKQKILEEMKKMAIHPMEAKQATRVVSAVSAQIHAKRGKISREAAGEFIGVQLDGSQLGAFATLVANAFEAFANAPALNIRGELEEEAQEALQRLVNEFGASTILLCFASVGLADSRSAAA